MAYEVMWVTMGGGGGIAQDGSTLTNSASGNATETVTTSVTLSTSGTNRMVYALVTGGAQGGTLNSGGITVSGGGLTWTQLAEAEFWESKASIWSAPAATQLTSQTITAQCDSPFATAYAVSLSVVALTGASSTAGVSQVAAGDGLSPQVTLTGTTSGSWALVAVAYGEVTAPTLTGNLATPYQNATWTSASPYAFNWRHFDARLASPSGGGNITLGASAPTANQVAVAAVEVLAA